MAAFRSDPSILNSLVQAPFRVLLREAMLLKACLGQPGVYLQMRTFLKIPTSKLPDEILDKILKFLLIPGISEKLIPKAGSTTVSSADLGATTAAQQDAVRNQKQEFLKNLSKQDQLRATTAALCSTARGGNE